MVILIYHERAFGQLSRFINAFSNIVIGQILSFNLNEIEGFNV